MYTYTNTYIHTHTQFIADMDNLLGGVQRIYAQHALHEIQSLLILLGATPNNPKEAYILRILQDPHAKTEVYMLRIRSTLHLCDMKKVQSVFCLSSVCSL